MTADQDETSSNFSSRQSTILTPSSTRETYHSPFPDPHNVPPTPGYTYVIRVKDTDMAITLTPNGLSLQPTDCGRNARNRWLCVEEGMYLGFYNEKSKVFIGHDTKGNVHATATKLKDWERLSPRHHRTGGYELLSPHWLTTKWKIVAADNNTRLARTEYGHTLWVFEEC